MIQVSERNTLVALLLETVQASHQLMLDGVARRCTARGDSQLTVDRAHMRVYRQQTDDDRMFPMLTSFQRCRSKHLSIGS